MKGVKRKETREKLKEFKAICVLIRILKKYFPGLLEQLNSVNDPRNSSRTKYESDVIFFTRIIAAIFRLDSMRKLTAELNDENTILNVSKILKKPDLDELPHFNTINNFLEKFDPKELQKIIQMMVKRLMKMPEFRQDLYRKKYWLVAIDGTQLYQTDEEHSEGALFKVHKNNDDTIKWVEYYYYIVEAKLVLTDKIVISVYTTFCRNDENVTPYDETKTNEEEITDGETSGDDVISEEKLKQDCELKAFYRMAEELKKFFGNTSICMTMDSLYAGAPVFDIFRENNWKYIIRFKEGKIKSIATEFNKACSLKDKRPNYREFIVDGGNEKYEYLNAVTYQGQNLNMVRYTEAGETHPFFFITNLPINRKNCKDLVSRGRKRWKIENEGFNIQKNHGYALTHRFSMNYNAMQNHYFLIQIAHAISQVYENLSIHTELKLALYRIHSLLKDAFKLLVVSEEEVQTVQSEKSEA